jgi:hypothetical protein
MGIPMREALFMPLTLLQDIIAGGQLLGGGFRRIFTEEEDVEADFIRTFSLR